MQTFVKRILVMCAAMTLFLTSSICAFAGNNSTASSTGAYTAMIKYIRDPSSNAANVGGINGNTSAEKLSALTNKTYPAKNGGYYLYTEITSGVGNKLGSTTDVVDEAIFNDLTTGSKQKYLKDLFTAANSYAYFCEHTDKGQGGANPGVTTETVGQLYEYLEAKEGMGSVLMASIMENTKPDFATANRIYKPFSGLVGTILGSLAIGIMALLGITMALDIAYIVIPAVQLMLDGGEGGGNHPGMAPGQPGSGGGKGKGLSGLVSQAARNAVQAANGQGNQGQGGEGNKMALGVYFKYRWLELVVLGICLLYLVSGNIYSFVAWILDLVSGFLGF